MESRTPIAVSLLLSVVCLLSIVIGCGISDLDRRVTDTLATCKETAEGVEYGWGTRAGARMILECLEKTAVRDLSLKPILAGALGLPFKVNEGVLLCVYWVEAQPSVDAVELSSQRLGVQLLLPVSSDYKAENEDCARSSVSYRTVHVWPKAEVPGVIIENDCMVSLFRNGSCVSERRPITFSPEVQMIVGNQPET